MAKQSAIEIEHELMARILWALGLTVGAVQPKTGSEIGKAPSYIVSVTTRANDGFGNYRYPEVTADEAVILTQALARNQPS